MKTSKVATFASLLDMAANYLPKDKYEHSLRVMLNVMTNEHIPGDIHDDCILVAIAHDLMEDADITVSMLPVDIDDSVFKAIRLLTHDKSISYDEYIKTIKTCKNTRHGLIAYWVKLADMKDHLARKATLTDKLKDKYLSALPYLLP